MCLLLIIFKENYVPLHKYFIRNSFSIKYLKC
nr:MAG TPA: hypothetical protein [Caudoviricetes sp.]DAQ12201.1 MAG TPA: hypothetical protein [Caudoviricetes sp.]